MIFEFAHYHIPIGVSLGVVMALLSGGVVLSVVYKRGLARGKDKEPPEMGASVNGHSSPVSVACLGTYRTTSHLASHTSHPTTARALTECVPFSFSSLNSALTRATRRDAASARIAFDPLSNARASPL